MKLFSQPELKQRKDQELTREILRTEEMQKVAEKARKGMANAEADFKEMLATHKEKWAKEEQEHTVRLRQMASEIDGLEERKKQALIPIQVYKQMADEKMNEAVAAEEVVAKKEEEIEDLREKLEDRLDEVGEREGEVRIREARADYRELGLNSQSDIIDARSKELSKKIAEFTAKKENDEKDIYERKELLFLKERDLVAREATLKRNLEALVAREKQLEDQRQTLEREYERLRKPK